jgi:hypothetical protein
MANSGFVLFMQPRSPNPFPALFMLAGLAVLASGAWWVYRPAGLMVIGLGLIAMALYGSRGTPSGGGQ